MLKPLLDRVVVKMIESGDKGARDVFYAMAYQISKSIGNLAVALNGNVDANFLEGMGCVAGCVGGPKAIIPPEQGKKSADDFAYDSPIKVPVHSSTLDKVLEKLDIHSIADFHDKEKISIFEREF